MSNSVKKVMVLTVAFLLMVGVVFAGGAKEAEGGSLKKIKVGCIASQMSCPVRYGLDIDAFKKAGLDVELLVFPNAPPMNEALASGQLDISLGGTATAFAMANDVASLVGESVKAGKFGIFVRKDSKILTKQGEVKGKPNIYGSADTIKGTKFLGPLSGTSQLHVMNYTSLFGLTNKDYTMVHMEWGPAYQAFIAGEGDAIASVQPYTFNLEESGNYVNVGTLFEIRDEEFWDPIVASKVILKKDPAMIKTFLAMYYKLCEQLESDKNLYFDVAYKWLKDNGRTYPEKLLRKELVDRPFATKKIVTAPGYKVGQTMLSVGKFYVESGRIQKELFPNIEKNIRMDILEEALNMKF